MNARTFQCEVCFRSAHQIALRDDLADWIVNIDPVEPPLPVQPVPAQRMRMVSVISLNQAEPDFDFDFDDYEDEDDDS